jgi:Tol biopolymer transport system component
MTQAAQGKPKSIATFFLATCLAAGFASTIDGTAATSKDEIRPTLFGEAVFTTGAYDFFVALTPDQQTAYFCRATADFGSWTILETHRTGDGWAAPKMAPFSGRWSDADPHVTLDGSKLFFISNRPDSGDTARPSCDIWVVERSGKGWGPPRSLGPEVCTDVTEWSPSVAANGNLYFGSARDGGKGRDDLWMSRFVDGRYTAPVNLGDSINTKFGEIEPWIAPDESYLIFSAGGRVDGRGGLDLYISVRRDGTWSSARPLGHGINSEAFDFNPSVSPDGRTFYFTSARSRLNDPPARARTYEELTRALQGPGNGLGDIYSIPIEALETSR